MRRFVEFRNVADEMPAADAAINSHSRLTTCAMELAMYSLRRTILTAAMAFFSASVLAYEVPKRSLEARIHSADIVIVGTIVALDPDDPNKPDVLAIATVRVDSILKGGATVTVRVVYREGIQESDPICCSLGGQYFMMLSRSDADLYRSVNGPYGIFEIGTSGSDQDGVPSWPGSTVKRPLDWRSH
ncbi:hypothetical protein [Luteibacter sp. dw_328]|uniref:hypothetical protein n=1 Tax=Luteibacter sp. dw_328 TaxID=2719796 RepID=UPI001BD4F0CE|nr:hypothetical protein [Luteibacter sp. dw_328]